MNRTARHPVFAIVRHDQGRSLKWLARETGFSYPYVRMVSAGMEKGSPRFRAACARVLGMDEAVLFHNVSGAIDFVIGAETAVGSQGYPTEEEPSVGIPA